MFLCFLSAIRSVRLDALFGVFMASRVSSGGVVSRVQRVRVLLSCPSMSVNVFLQSPCISFHPLLPGPIWILLIYIHRCLSCVLGVCGRLGGTMFHPSWVVVILVDCGC